MSQDLTREYNVREAWRELVLQEGPCGHCGVVVEFVMPEGGGGLSYHHVITDPEDEEAWTSVMHQFLIGICRRKQCGKPTVLYRTVTEKGYQGLTRPAETEVRLEVLFPRGAGRRTNLPASVPEPLCRLYAEAAGVEYLSPTSAAHLCGVMLEHSLRKKLGKKKAMLAELIGAFQQTENPPPALAEMMSTLKGFRNIAAHAGEDDTGDLLTVDQAEASYLLDAIPQLFHFIYVQPERAAQMKARLQAKNNGKNPGPPDGSAFVVEEAPTREWIEQRTGSPLESSDDLPF